MSIVEGFRGGKDRISKSIVFGSRFVLISRDNTFTFWQNILHRFCPDFEFNGCPVEMVRLGDGVDIFPY
jgi:hypothetical protein